MSTPLKIDPIEELLADYRQGKMVVLVDDEDRENEGDFLIAADCVTDEAINFMATHGRGLICLTITEERSQQLDLPLMVSMNNARFSTAFTLSIEAAEGVTTGISAGDRATTIRAAVKRNAVPTDIVMPGHIFPIKARPGGVLTRAGHTEAGVDMARLAGYEPASVICEILKPDGTMARLPDLIPVAKDHGLKIGTIADLIEYRMANDPTVVRVEQSKLNTAYGEFTATVYEDQVEGDVHMALSYGDVKPDSTSLVRVHVHRGLFDMVVTPENKSTWSIDDSMKAIAESGQGVLTLLAYNEHKDELVSRMQNRERSDARSGDAPKTTNINGEPNKALRMLGAGGQILADQGVGNLAVLGRERKAYALSGFGLEITEYLPDYESYQQWKQQ
ncbi:MAG: 3,4-dihydroxy 2-butanone 4-phosphate synthase/GTP cyclohydrolase II [Parvicella sp.]|jgi:3,4-dihydroxy 2-butanone 4-phosphate synthase/GTP cyclohydrolase II